jgi:ABC-type Fe3+/spermidine/putrescine transport system ATPase subunit
MAVLDVEHVTKAFVPGVSVLSDVNLHVAQGEIACLLGPSGCGKTTLLRIIGGLETPDRGRILCDGEDITGRPVYLRNFGFMFQDYALFPHMSVAANVGFGLRMAGWDKPRQQRRVDEMLEVVNLRTYGQRSVDELSGGEQQRVALARTLAPAPRLLLLDEPLANLDRLLREELVDELHAIIRRVGVTTIFVTHDQAEAFALADHVVVMRAGGIAQEGAPQEVHRRPANAFVAGFLGFHNLLEGKVATDGRSVATTLGVLPLAHGPEPELLVQPHRVLIRPDAVTLRDGVQGGADDAPHAGLVRALAGHIVSGSFRGGVYRIQFAPDPAGEPLLQFDLPTRGGRPLPKVGEWVRLELDPDGVLLIAS